MVLIWNSGKWKTIDENYYCPHLIEIVYQSSASSWKKFNRSPPTRQIYQASRVIIIKENSYHYIKNCNGNIGPVPDDELVWILLHV